MVALSDVRGKTLIEKRKEGGVMSSFLDRIIRAAKLDVSLYEEVEADTTALGQAMGVVILSSMAAGVGSVIQVVLMWMLFTLLGASGV